MPELETVSGSLFVSDQMVLISTAIPFVFFAAVGLVVAVLDKLV